jgi:hypothetical protein
VKACARCAGHQSLSRDGSSPCIQPPDMLLAKRRVQRATPDRCAQIHNPDACRWLPQSRQLRARGKASIDTCSTRSQRRASGRHAAGAVLVRSCCQVVPLPQKTATLPNADACTHACGQAAWRTRPRFSSACCPRITLFRLVYVLPPACCFVHRNINAVPAQHMSVPASPCTPARWHVSRPSCAAASKLALALLAARAVCPGVEQVLLLCSCGRRFQKMRLQLYKHHCGSNACGNAHQLPAPVRTAHCARLTSVASTQVRGLCDTTSSPVSRPASRALPSSLKPRSNLDCASYQCRCFTVRLRAA